MGLCSKDECTGCLACYNICTHKAIDLLVDEEGFVYPSIIRDKCKDCGLCSSVCPILTPYTKKTNSYIECFAAWSKKSMILKNSSSGGVFSTIAGWILQNKGVVYGAAFDTDFKVYHTRVDSESGLAKLRGSKYVQSFIGEIYQTVKTDIISQRWILFVGTPCQIDGLLRFLGRLSENERLITIDLVCHGVPSPLMFQEYKCYLEKKYQSSLCAYEFRNKKWSWLHFNVKAEFINGQKYIGTWEEDSFLKGFLREYFSRPSCYHCVYANKQRVADLTIGDYWGYQRKVHEKKNNDDGVSIILVHSQKGKFILKELTNEMYLYSRTLDESTTGNETFEAPYPQNPNRKKFWSDYKLFGYNNKVIEKYLFPDPISKNLQYLYKYGGIVYKTILLIKHTIKRIIRTFK